MKDDAYVAATVEASMDSRLGCWHKRSRDHSREILEATYSVVAEALLRYIHTLALVFRRRA